VALEILKNLTDTVFLDLERPGDFRKLEEAELFFDNNLEKLVCIDEVQLGNNLFPIMRVSVDKYRKPGRLLILGSGSQELIRKSSETLAGRISYLELSPFTIDELIANDDKFTNEISSIWWRGGFPDSILANSSRISQQWRENFIKTFLERDIPQFGFRISAMRMHRFWTMLAHYHGALFNASKISQSLGVKYTSVQHYVDILEQTFMLRVLRPLIVNTRKRLIKSPKVYIRDSGILHTLLEIGDLNSLMGHPVAGASWEGFCIEQIVNILPKWRAGFYRTSSGEEIDLVLEKGLQRLTFEIKLSTSPTLSKGYPETIKLLNPEKSWLVAPIKDSWKLRNGTTVISITELIKELEEFK